MSKIVRDIEALAEGAIRTASGDWEAAGEQFRSQIESRPEARQELWDRIIFQELRAAAHRLGATTRPCPHCSEEIPLDSLVCRFCGRSQLPPGATSAPLAPPHPVTGGSIIRNFTLLTGWILIVLMVILIFAFSR